MMACGSHSEPHGCVTRSGRQGSGTCGRELRLLALRGVPCGRACLPEEVLRSPTELPCLLGSARCRSVDEGLGPVELPRHALRNGLADTRSRERCVQRTARRRAGERGGGRRRECEGRRRRRRRERAAGRRARNRRQPSDLAATLGNVVDRTVGSRHEVRRRACVRRDRGWQSGEAIARRVRRGAIDDARSAVAEHVVPAERPEGAARERTADQAGAERAGARCRRRA
jgi:hypothetical protein